MLNDVYCLMSNLPKELAVQKTARDYCEKAVPGIQDANRNEVFNKNL